ncbi:MAG: T9SS type A sorting domain-containing protein [Candidatus Eisenbacteria bacterium]|nr:T9SS type A sorting domain-containing protein [Candidatus Eisenbacteria bacterium]
MSARHERSRPDSGARAVLFSTVRWVVFLALAAGIAALLWAVFLAVDAAALPSASLSAGAVGGGFRLVSRDDGGRIFLWDEYGRPAPGWPVAASGAWPAGVPRLQDLDGDGQPEVVCLLKSWDGGQTVRAWRLDGQPAAGFAEIPCPRDMADTPELGDIERRGRPDWVWVGTSGDVLASEAGDPSARRPISPLTNFTGRPRLRLADADGDGVPDVLGGVEEGPAGRWFCLFYAGSMPVYQERQTSVPVTAAPQPARVGSDAAPCLLVPLAGGVGRWDGDGLRGFHAATGWPATAPVGPVGGVAVLADRGQRILALGRDGRLAAWAADGSPLGTWGDGARPGRSLSQTDLAACSASAPPGTRAAWAAHDGGTALGFVSDAGSDSAGRPRLFRHELGHRHHGVSASAPAGLLPPGRFRLWVNGAEGSAAGPVLRLTGGEVELRGALEEPALSGDPEVEIRVFRGAAAVGRATGRSAVQLRLSLESGTYTAVACARGDTLGGARFQVELPLALRDVFNYPNPVRTATDFLFALTRSARVRVDVFTVAGRRVRGLEGDFGEGRQRLGWDGRDATGEPVARGVYFYRVTARSGSESAETIGKLVRLD